MYRLYGSCNTSKPLQCGTLWNTRFPMVQCGTWWYKISNPEPDVTQVWYTSLGHGLCRCGTRSRV
jgi:hypothetical protein